MPITVNHKDGWLYPGPLSNDVHDLSATDLSTLLMMADEEDQWAERIRQEVIDRDRSLHDGSWKTRPRTDWVIEELQIMYAPAPKLRIIHCVNAGK